MVSQTHPAANAVGREVKRGWKVQFIEMAGVGKGVLHTCSERQFMRAPHSIADYPPWTTPQRGPKTRQKMCTALIEDTSAIPRARVVI